MQLVRKYQTSGKIEEKQNKALDANKTMQEYATDWYTRRAATGRYEDQLGGDKLQGVLERINNTKPSRESFKNQDGSLSFYNTAKVQDTSRDVRGYHTKGTNFWSSRTLLLNRDTPWHEAIGHQIYDELPLVKWSTNSILDSIQDYLNEISQKSHYLQLMGESHMENI